VTESCQGAVSKTRNLTWALVMQESKTHTAAIVLDLMLTVLTGWDMLFDRPRARPSSQSLRGSYPNHATGYPENDSFCTMGF